MSARRQTRRTKRVSRLSGSEDLSLEMNIEEPIEAHTSAEQAAAKQVDSETRNVVQAKTPMQAKAANEMGDVEGNTVMRQRSQTNTPARPVVQTSENAADRAARNVTPVRYPANDSNISRLETICEKLMMAMPTMSQGSKTAPKDFETNKQSEAERAASIDTDTLCDEMMRRLELLSSRSEAEKRRVARDRGAQAMVTICDLMASMRNDPKSQQYIKDVMSGKVNELDYSENSPSASTSKAPETTRQPCCEIFNPSHMILGTTSPTLKTSNRKTAPTQNEEISAPIHPKTGVSNADREHSEQLVRKITEEIRESERARKRRRSSSPTMNKRYRTRDRSKENENEKIVVPRFDGNDWPAFKSVFESVAAHKKWKPDFKALQLKCSITGAARATLNVIDSSDWTYEQLVDHFEQRCGKRRTKVEVMNDLDKLSRKPDQSLTSWRDEVITVANSGSLTEAQYRELTHYNFLRGLGTYPQMLHWVTERDTGGTLQSCYEIAKRYEREVGTPGILTTRPTRVAAISVPTTSSVDSLETVEIQAISSHQSANAALPANPVLEKVIKTSNETTELIEKLQKELAEVKRRNNFKWRGGRGGRGRGRGRGHFEFGRRYQNNNNTGSEESNQTNKQQARTTEGNQTSAKSE